MTFRPPQRQKPPFGGPVLLIGGLLDRHSLFHDCTKIGVHRHLQPLHPGGPHPRLGDQECLRCGFLGNTVQCVGPGRGADRASFQLTLRREQQTRCCGRLLDFAYRLWWFFHIHILRLLTVISCTGYCANRHIVLGSGRRHSCLYP